MGASIVTLSKAVSKTNSAAQEAKLSAAESVTHLKKLLDEVEASIPKMDMMLETMERSSQRTVKESRAIQQELVETLRPLLNEADTKTDALSAVMHQADHFARNDPPANEAGEDNRSTRRAIGQQD